MVTMTFIFMSLAVFMVLLFIVWYLNLFRYRQFLKDFPGPTPIPLIGNALDFKNTIDVLPKALGMIQRYGGVFRVFIGPYPRLIIADPKAIEFVLGSTSILEKSYDYKYFYDWLGTGLLTSSKAKWKKHRKLLTPTFHFQILEQYTEIFDSQSNILIERLNQEATGNPVDIYPYITLCALDVICEAAMGTQVYAQKYSDSEYVRSVKEMCRIVMERALSALKMSDMLYIFSKDYQKQRKALRILHDYTNAVITKRREELMKNQDVNGSTMNKDDMGIKKRMAFLDLLLQCTLDGKPLPDDVIREEVDTFMFEGHDTTASAMSFTLYCLSKHPKIQEKVVEELRGIFNNDKFTTPTYKDLQEMKYLELVIKETLRFYPSVPGYARILDEDVEFDGKILPKGLALTLFPLGLHLQSDLFPEPEKFDPERFLPENCNGRSPYAYVPFSAGPRNCIGQRFAMLEMKSTISKVLRHYELFPVENHQVVLKAESILKSDNGVCVRLKKREF